MKRLQTKRKEATGRTRPGQKDNKSCSGCSLHLDKMVAQKRRPRLMKGFPDHVQPRANAPVSEKRAKDALPDWELPGFVDVRGRIYGLAVAKFATL